jgi:hypothetical protein
MTTATTARVIEPGGLNGVTFMFYAARFRAALAKLCSPQSRLTAGLASSLPCSIPTLAAMLADNGWEQWQNGGLSPMQGAICSIGTVIEKSKHERVHADVVAYLRAALAAHAVHHPEDADMISRVLFTPEEAKQVDALADHLGL